MLKNNNMIETKRLILRPLSLDELTKHIKSPDELAKDLGLAPSKALVDAETQEAILNDLLPNLEDKNKDPLFYTMWIVIEKSNKAIIGGICFHGEPDENGQVEIGYGTDEEFRNKGYMTETISGLIEWTRENKNIKAIKAETKSTNISSIRVLERNNFKKISQTENSVILQLLLK